MKICILVLFISVNSFGAVSGKCRDQILKAIDKPNQLTSEPGYTVSIPADCNYFNVDDLDPELMAKVSKSLFKGGKSTAMPKGTSLSGILGRMLIKPEKGAENNSTTGSAGADKKPGNLSDQKGTGSQSEGGYCVTSENRPGKWHTATQEEHDRAAKNASPELQKYLPVPGKSTCDATSSTPIDKEKGSGASGGSSATIGR